MKTHEDCAHCGGSGEVTGEYPGVACSACCGTGKAPVKESLAAERHDNLPHMTPEQISARAKEFARRCKAAAADAENPAEQPEDGPVAWLVDYGDGSDPEVYVGERPPGVAAECSMTPLYPESVKAEDGPVAGWRPVAAHRPRYGQRVFLRRSGVVQTAAPTFDGGDDGDFWDFFGIDSAEVDWESDEWMPIDDLGNCLDAVKAERDALRAESAELRQRVMKLVDALELARGEIAHYFKEIRHLGGSWEVKRALDRVDQVLDAYPRHGDAQPQEPGNE